ncbi:MAG: menaquinone biosynthesis protein [Gemmatimonadetes bacterium]|nr:menaquinone biosynthesis protein [Gemmatimonadota bacterium]
MMIRLGNIDYSNCYPIHGPVLERDRPDWLEVVDGPPSDLNRRLANGELDVAPGSSIELARHSREYGVLRGLCIGSAGPVESIIFVSRLPLRELAGQTVALPTASATSRCLLRILLEVRLGVEPVWVDFDQRSHDPLISGPGTAGHVDAALFIGDVALRREGEPGELLFDLGYEWTEWTGLPFVYALWLVRGEVADRSEIHELHRLFLQSRDAAAVDAQALASLASGRYGFPTLRLQSYWSRIRYDLDEQMLEGLEHFLALASEIGDAPRIDGIRLIP